MIKHVAMVHERKQFKCDICNIRFTSKQIMIYHVAAVHEENKQFNTNFGQKGNLKRHVATIHD